jgi:hypothetical protein
MIDGSDVVLRATSPNLWVARCGDYPVGMIEHGRRYSAVDLDGEVVARCRTLQEARQALASSGAPHSHETEGRRATGRWWTGAAGAAGAPLTALSGLALRLTRR